MLGTANGVDVQQITLGDGGYGTLTDDRVINNQNTFREYYRDSQFINTGSTTASVDATAFKVDFTSGELLQSEVIFTNGDDETVIEGKFITTGGTASPSATALTYFLSANKGTNWETATLNSALTFTNTGTALQYKITSTGTVTIGSRDNNGYDFPLKISYVTRS